MRQGGRRDDERRIVRVVLVKALLIALVIDGPPDRAARGSSAHYPAIGMTSIWFFASLLELFESTRGL